MSTTTITVIDRATVARINREHEACQRAYGDAFTHAVQAGRLLAGVKDELAHGEFGAWLSEHFAGSDRTARVYMQLAAAPEIEDRQSTADLSIAAALKHVSTPRPRPEAPPDVGSALQGLAGPSGSRERLDEARERLQAERVTAWTAQQERKRLKLIGMIDDVRSRLSEAASPALSGFAVGEILRAAEGEARQAAAMLDELAFGFER